MLYLQINVQAVQTSKMRQKGSELPNGTDSVFILRKEISQYCHELSQKLDLETTDL